MHRRLMDKLAKQTTWQQLHFTPISRTLVMTALHECLKDRCFLQIILCFFFRHYFLGLKTVPGIEDQSVHYQKLEKDICWNQFLCHLAGMLSINWPLFLWEERQQRPLVAKPRNSSDHIKPTDTSQVYVKNRRINKRTKEPIQRTLTQHKGATRLVQEGKAHTMLLLRKLRQ